MRPSGDSKGDIEMCPSEGKYPPTSDRKRTETEFISVKPQPVKPQLPSSEVKNVKEFLNFDESEESTCIESITLVKYNLFMGIFVVPLLCLATGLILALVMYWNIKV